MSKHKFNLPAQALNTSNLNTAFNGGPGTAADKGAIAYNTITNSLSVWNGTTWDGAKELLTGRVVLVDISNPNATDTRTGLSNYSQVFPFLTIQAALNVVGNTDVLHIKNGTYTENVSRSFTQNYYIIYENVIHTGTTASALHIHPNNGIVRLTMINSSITNTGDSGNRETTAAVYFEQPGAVHIVGISGLKTSLGYIINETSKFQSTESYGLYTSGVGANYCTIQNIEIYSTNHHATLASFSYAEYDAVKFISTNGRAHTASYDFIARDCYFKGADYGINFPSNMRFQINLNNCYIESTSGNAIGGGSLGGSVSNFGELNYCTIVSYNEAISFGTGNSGINYHVRIQYTTFNITNAANTFNFPNSGTAMGSDVQLRYVNSNVILTPTGFTEVLLKETFNASSKNFLIGDNTSDRAALLPRTSLLSSVITPTNGMIIQATENYGTAGQSNPDVYAYSNNSWHGLTKSRIVEQYIAGAVSLDLSQGNFFKLTLTGNVTSFTFTNEVIGRQYTFMIIKTLTDKTFAFTAGKYYFSFGTTPTLTNPTTNGSSPARSEDILTAICRENGRLDVVITPNMLPN